MLFNKLVKKPIFIVSISEVLVRMINAINFFFVSMFVAPTELGVIASCWVVIFFAEAFFDLGLNSIYVRKDDKSLDKGIYFTIILFCGIFWFLFSQLGAYLYGYLTGLDIVLYIQVLSLAFLLKGTYASFEAKQIKNKKYIKICKRELTNSSLSVACSVFLVVNGYGVWAIIVRYLLLAMLNFLYFIATDFTNMQIRLTPAIYWFKQNVKETFYISLSTHISWLLTAQAERIVIQGISLAALGLWSFASKPNEIIGMVFSAITNKYFYKLLSELKTTENIRERLKRYTAFYILTSIAASSSTVFFGYFIVEKFWAEEWQSSQFLILMFAIALPFRLTTTLYVALFNAQGQAKKYFKLSLFSALVNVAVLIIFSNFGLEILAISNAIVRIVLSFLIFYFAFRLIDERMKDEKNCY